MTEYDYSPEALDAYNRSQARIAHWAHDVGAEAHQFKSPFAPRSDVGDDESSFYRRPNLPHRRSSSAGPSAVYNSIPAHPVQYSRNNPPGPLPGPLPPAYYGVPYYQSPPATVVPNGGSLYRSQSQDALSQFSLPHSHRAKHKSRHHSRSPTYVIQSPPAYTSMVSPPLSTASNTQPMWYPQQTAYTTQPTGVTTPPQLLSPTHVPYAYPYSTSPAPAGMQYQYYTQPQTQPQTQYIVIKPSKSRKSSKPRKVIQLTGGSSSVSRSHSATPSRSTSPDHRSSHHHSASLLSRLLDGLHIGHHVSHDSDSSKHRRSSSVLRAPDSHHVYDRESTDYDDETTRGRRQSRKNKTRRARSGS